MSNWNEVFTINKPLQEICDAVLPIIRSLDRMHFEACIVAALCEGELSEVEAARKLGVEIVKMRGIKINVISRVCENYDLRMKGFKIEDES